MKPGIVQIWQDLSLRTRLFLPLGAMFVVALILGAVLLQNFAAEQLIEENEPAARSARQLAEALNARCGPRPIRNARWKRLANRSEPEDDSVSRRGNGSPAAARDGTVPTSRGASRLVR